VRSPWVRLEAVRGWHLRGNIGATSPTEIDRDKEAETRSKSLAFQLDRDRPRSQPPPLNPKVEGSNPSRPKPLVVSQCGSGPPETAIRTPVAPAASISGGQANARNAFQA